MAGTGSMVLGSLAAGAVLIPLALLLRRRLGWVTGWAIAGLLWSVVVIALVTLLPTDASIGVVPAESRLPECSMDYGGPAPDGFWILSGGQRALNTLLFVPAGAFLVLAVSRWRAGLVLAPVGLLGLAGYSLLIERTQFELARIDRACDITDVVDNVTGAVIGFAIGLVLVLVLRPWRHRSAQ
ncbi:VanZ family protein [Nocardioides sp. LHG3406-4]|uniref:VanZ family protein n=1 Tax=Nocardioides sp. LHG3406-4 TaxID=2804575 RepID=UPI003CF61657